MSASLTRQKILSADDLFRQIGIKRSTTTLWGEDVPERGSGVYIVSLENADIAIDRLTIRERSFWNADQTVIYIGRSNNLRRRLKQFQRHKYGQPRPHRGGEAILLLEGRKIIQWASVTDYAKAERRLIEAFKARVGRMPFGNRVRSAAIRRATHLRSNPSIKART